MLGARRIASSKSDVAGRLQMFDIPHELIIHLIASYEISTKRNPWTFTYFTTFFILELTRKIYDEKKWGKFSLVMNDVILSLRKN